VILCNQDRRHNLRILDVEKRWTKLATGDTQNRFSVDDIPNTNLDSRNELHCTAKTIMEGRLETKIISSKFGP
jgi:hypothetical protein